MGGGGRQMRVLGAAGLGGGWVVVEVVVVVCVYVLGGGGLGTGRLGAGAHYWANGGCTTRRHANPYPSVGGGGSDGGGMPRNPLHNPLSAPRKHRFI